jgi:deoxyhypusine synthase
MSSLIPHGASAAVLKQSAPVPDEAIAVQGPNFDERPTLETLLDSYERIGFQANSLGKAINIVNKMVGAPPSLSVCHLPTLTFTPPFLASLAPLR